MKRQPIDDAAEFWRAHKTADKQRRAANREAGAIILEACGIAFVEKNGGAHLIVAGEWDFWPGTGLWRERLPRSARGRRGRGVRNLIDIIRQGQQ